MPSPLDRDVIEAGARAAATGFAFDRTSAVPAALEMDHWRSAYLGVVAELIRLGILPRSTDSPEEGNRG